MKYADKEQFDEANVFGQGIPNDMFARYFVGNSYLNPLTDFQNGEFPLFNVTFEPGCRNSWHIHHADKGGGRSWCARPARAGTRRRARRLWSLRRV